MIQRACVLLKELEIGINLVGSEVS
jgi:hypothetical protein